MKIPVILINRNLLTWTSGMVEQIKTFDDVGDIIIVDNNSTYEPLLEWYKTSPCEVIHAGKNYGQSAPWEIKLPEKRNYDYYVVSDPDMDLSETPKDNLLHLVEKLKSHSKYDRIGLSLSNYDLPLNSPYYHHIKNWKEKYWKEDTIVDGLLTTQLFDTTYGMYQKNRSFSGLSCCTNKPYSAKHIPWEITFEQLHNLKEENYEFYYYLKHAEGCTSYKAFVNFKTIFNE